METCRLCENELTAAVEKDTEVCRECVGMFPTVDGDVEVEFKGRGDTIREAVVDAHIQTEKAVERVESER